ncbi:MAG: hypothetical protein F4X20_06590 [Dehalococcoidia bacterium]|nr:hypothetical protein [Dehalococcoidia bacterium]
MTIQPPRHAALPPVPRKPNNVDQLEIPLARRRHSGNRGDGLPEDTLYIDRGCGDDCTRSLECPYPRCRYDEPLAARRERLTSRDKAIVAARFKEGLPIAVIAERFNVGTRTVFRVLRSARSETKPATTTKRKATI